MVVFYQINFGWNACLLTPDLRLFGVKGPTFENFKFLIPRQFPLFRRIVWHFCIGGVFFAESAFRRHANLAYSFMAPSLRSHINRLVLIPLVVTLAVPPNISRVISIV